jgi:hypothetical protein
MHPVQMFLVHQEVLPIHYFHSIQEIQLLLQAQVNQLDLQVQLHQQVQWLQQNLVHQQVL